MSCSSPWISDLILGCLCLWLTSCPGSGEAMWNCILHTHTAPPVSLGRRQGVFSVFSPHKYSCGSPAARLICLWRVGNISAVLPDPQELSCSIPFWTTTLCAGRQGFRDQKTGNKRDTELRNRDHIESVFMSPFHLPLRRWQLSDELFFICQGYRAEMDNPAMLILLPPVLRNRKDVLFGNMPEIYDFHNKYGVALFPLHQTDPLEYWNNQTLPCSLLHFCPFSDLLQNFPAQFGKLPGSPRESGMLFPRQGGWIIFTYKADWKASVSPGLLHSATPQLCWLSEGLLTLRTSSQASRDGAEQTWWPEPVIPSYAFFTQTLSLLDIEVGSRDKSTHDLGVGLLWCPAGLGPWGWLASWLALQRENFQIYEKYCQNKPRSESLWRQCSESSFFQVSCLSCPGRHHPGPSLILNTLLNTPQFSCVLFSVMWKMHTKRCWSFFLYPRSTREIHCYCYNISLVVGTYATLWHETFEAIKPHDPIVGVTTFRWCKTYLVWVLCSRNAKEN